MKVKTIDSRVINGVRIFRAVLWNSKTKTGHNLYSPSREGLSSQVDHFIKAEKSMMRI